jgi:hypothetical protein
MKQLTWNILPLAVILSSCSGDDGQTDPIKTFFLIAAIIGFLALGAAQSKKQAQQKEGEAAADQQYLMEFSDVLSKNGFVCSNKVTGRQEFGLAVNDDLKSIAYFSPGKELTIYDQSKIVACEYKINYNEFINSKSKVPVASWNTIAKTKGEVVRTFASADLYITLLDVSKPLLKLKFYEEKMAEKYNALFHLVIKQSRE